MKNKIDLIFIRIVGYFKKQGFTNEITFDGEKWKGRIKDYEGGTLMECKIFECVNYSKISKHIAKQKEVLIFICRIKIFNKILKWVIEEIKKLCINEKIFEGLKPNDFPIISLTEIPGLSNLLLC